MSRAMMCLRVESSYKLKQPTTVSWTLTEDLRPVVGDERLLLTAVAASALVS